MTIDTQVRLLGPVELVEPEGQPVPITGRLARAVLALMALACPRSLTDDELRAQLWPSGAPRSAGHALQVYVSRLRTALQRAGFPQETLERSGDGYRLALDVEVIDARRFEVLVARASRETDPDRARGLVEEGLSLWRGDPLKECPDTPQTRAEAERLQDLRVTAVGRLAESLVELDRCREAVALLEPAVAAAPLREHLHAVLMVALYRTGRRSEALDRYAEVYAMATELGLHPGPRLDALRDAITRDDHAGVSVHPPSAGGEPAASGPSSGTAGRAAAERAGGLPVPPYPLVGRRAELAEACRLLGGEDTGLVTLHGPGGVGKTRLAVAIVRQMADPFPAGVCWVDLSSLTDPSGVLPAIGAALGVVEDERVPVGERVAARLSGRRRLLVLDNFEQLLDAREDLRQLLAAAPQTRALVTSRTLLGIPEERAVAVEPLEIQLAAELFLKRAEEIRPGVGRSAAERDAVEAICARCDGLPLALAIVAARLEVFSLAALAGRLQDRLDVIAPADVPDRHRTLREAIGWSFFSLPEPERRALRALAAFGGSAGLSAARAVAAEGETDPDLHLFALASKSLVRVRTGADGEPRFTLLSTVREFASEQLAAAGERDAVRARHADHFLRFAERASEGLLGADQVRWLRALDDERANLRLALDLYTDIGATEAAAHLSALLGHYWDLRGLWAEADARLRAALCDESAPGDACRMCFWLGRQAWRRRQIAEATALLHRALALAEEVADLRVQAYVSGYLWLLGDDAPSLDRERHERIIDRCREAGDSWALAVALWEYGDALQSSGAWTEARPVLGESVPIARRLGNPQAIGIATGILGEAALRGGELALAETLLSESLDQARRIGHRWVVFSNLGDLAVLALHRGGVTRAAERVAEAVTLFELGVANEVRSTLAAGAALAAASRQPATAARLWSAYDRNRREHGLGHSGGAETLWNESLPAVREACGPDEWETAWASGQRLDDVMAVRLAGLAAERCLATAAASAVAGR